MHTHAGGECFLTLPISRFTIRHDVSEILNKKGECAVVEQTTVLVETPFLEHRFHAPNVHPAINIERSIATFLDFEAAAINAHHSREMQRAFELALRYISAEVLRSIVGARQRTCRLEFRTHFELLESDGTTSKRLLLPDRWPELVRRFLAQFDIVPEFHTEVAREAHPELQEHRKIQTMVFRPVTLTDRYCC